MYHAELIAAKKVKEANRFIQQWPAEKIAIENGRWGAFIRFGKKMLKLTGSGATGKYTPEELAVISLDEVKKMIVAQDPKAFTKKTKTVRAKTGKVPLKKAAAQAPKKTAVKKTAKKAAVKKAAKKK
jgi:DNA topoisomerase-1